MGDMKTPDFDDLLAAFDIPDATSLDAKETIHASKGESDSQLRPTGTCLEEGLHPTISAAVPTVNVNNSRQHDLVDGGVERSQNTITENGLSGKEIASLANTSDLSKPFGSLWNGDSSSELCELVGSAPLQQKPNGTFSQTLSDFSIAFTGPEDTNNEGTHPNKHDYFSNGLMERMNLDTSKNVVSEEFKEDIQTDDTFNEAKLNHFQLSFGNATDETPISHSEHNEKVISFEASKSANIPNAQAKSEAKLSPCLEALAALSAQKDSNELAAVQNECTKASPKAVLSPGSPCSPLETVKRLMKPLDSPVSVCSDSSGKFSPAVASSPAIPRVRIKTIKTSSGRIRRTVASVLPDSETDEVPSAYESSPCQSTVSEDSYNICPQNGQTSPKMVHNKSNCFTRKLQSSVGLKNKRQSTLHKVQKPKKSFEAHNSSNTNHVPKAMHLASLNLVPHSVAASVAARSTTNQSSLQTFSSSVYTSVPLVHQVSTPSPSPLNSAVGTLNRLLNYANPVPTYMPDLNPPAESNISLPPRGYRCLECGDSFSVERSLKFHYSRRSVHIEVTCTHCRKTLLFFNRCALLAHAREHKINGTVMQCTQLYMKPITEEQMFVPLSVGSSPEESCLLKSSSQKNQPVMPLYQEEHVTRQSLCCMECNQQCSDLKTLAGHYQRVSENSDRLMCKVCSMILPNKCSLRAHQRLHTHKSPYCCPECGVLSRSADIQNHIKENCLHYARKAWYKCLHCDAVFKSLQGQKSHIGEKHCEMFFKCTVCPVAFKSSLRCEGHLKSKHSAVNMSPQLIFKCSCETVFKKKQLLYQHFHENAFKRVKCVFKCPKCHSVFSSKQHLMQHFKGTHIGAAEKSWKLVHEADQDYTTQDKKTVISVKHTEDPQRKSDQNRARTKAKQGKRYPCRHCELSFNFTTSLKRHVRKDHDEKRKNYVCWYCTDATTTFASALMLKNHMSLMHGVKNPDFTRMPKSSDLKSKEFSRKGPGSLVSGAKRDKDDGGGEAPPEKRLKMCFRCAKCDFVTADSQEFEEHIPQHKVKDSTPQCTRCGLCFTSALALNRHLHIVHKVREPEDREPEGKTTVQSQNRGQ